MNSINSVTFTINFQNTLPSESSYIVKKNIDDIEELKINKKDIDTSIDLKIKEKELNSRELKISEKEKELESKESILNDKQKSLESRESNVKENEREYKKLLCINPISSDASIRPFMSYEFDK